MATEDKLVNLMDLKAAYDTLASVRGMLSGKLYKQIFGDDSDWEVSTTVSSATVKAAKVGQTITFTKTGTNGTTWNWVNLTGTTHRMFTGGLDTATSNIKSSSGDGDFINVNPFFATVTNSTARDMAININWYFNATALSSNSSNNTIGFYVIGRSYNSGTSEYDYSSMTAIGSKAFGSTAGDVHLTTVLASTKGTLQQYAINDILSTYDQIAIYVYRKSQTLAGELLIEPIKLAMPFDDWSETVSGSTPTITAVNGARYVCTASAVSELSFTPPEKGVASVRFVSGSTATVLSLGENAENLHLPAWFDPDHLAANTTYEISFADGFGVVASWT